MATEKTGSIYAYWYGAVGSTISPETAIYIGQSENPPVRFGQHFANSKKKVASLLEQKIAAYNNVVCAVIHPDIPVSKLGGWEQHYIQFYRTHTSQGGCNETWGG